jgi:hypothetical protein
MYKKDYQYSFRYISQLATSERIALLDVGCADGEFTSMFSDVANLFGVEINQDEAARASSRGIKIVTLDDLEAVQPNVIILRGTLQHITPAEYSVILNFQPQILIFLQTPNPTSFAYRLLKQNQIALLNPHKEFEGNLNLIELAKLKSDLICKGFRITSISKPYFSTPYFNPLQDIYQLISCLFNSSKRYTGSWKGNIYRMIAIKSETNG